MALCDHIIFKGFAGNEGTDSHSPSPWCCRAGISQNGSKWSTMQPSKLAKEPSCMDACMDACDQESWAKVGAAVATSAGRAGANEIKPSLIWACSKNRDLARGASLHEEVQRRGLDEKIYSDALITMYAKCGKLQKAQALLDMHSSSSAIPWTALIGGYARSGQGRNALECFRKSQKEGICPDGKMYASILKACPLIGAIEEGKQVHDEISRQKLLEHDIVLGGALVDMYARCGALSEAQDVLEKLPARNVISWSALITGYAEGGQCQQALECLRQMEDEGISPDAVTYVSILKACALTGAIDEGRHIHFEILRQGLLGCSMVLGGALVDMYVKCGALLQAQGVLENLPSRDAISWNALILGYAQMGKGHEALDCYKQMQKDGITPSAVTYACMLKACAVIEALDRGKQIHNEIMRYGLLEHDIVLSNALIDMYAKCDALPLAQNVLDKLPSRDTVSWNALISGYTQKGHAEQALECYKQAQKEGIASDEMTYACVLKACGLIKDFKKGKQIHEEILSQGMLESDIVLGGALVDMYAKCGALSEACSVLEKLPGRNVIIWNALIAGYGQKGQLEQAMHCFDQMQKEGILPNIVTFTCLLNVCCHLGLLEKGQELFDRMGAVYGLKPDVECFTCIVDLLGRAGHLAKAVKLVQEMPVAANLAIWHCLLGTCQKLVDTTVGAWAYEQAVKLDVKDESAYVSIISIYRAAGMIEKAKDIDAKRMKIKVYNQSLLDCKLTPAKIAVHVS